MSMKTLIVGAVFAGLFITRVAAAQAVDVRGDSSALRLHVVTDEGETDGTCVLIHRETHGTEVVLYFLTAAHLLVSPEDHRPLHTRSVRVILDGEHALDVRRDDTFIGGTLLDVAILRATAPSTTIVARPVVYEAPPIGDVFLISGYDQNGAATTLAERVRFQSTFLAVGDRDASPLAGCIGAPAISQQGVFGVVIECGAGRAPVIALFSMGRSFIEQHMPKPTTQASPAPQFDLVDKQVTGPLLRVACDATTSGEIDVPFTLESRESAVDATAAFVNPREVHLGDVTVLRLNDRSVRLRFTLGGAQAPPGPPTSCPQGQALVTVRVNITAVRSPE